MDKVNESILSETILEDMKENRIDHMTYLEGMEVLDSDVEKTVVDAMNAYDYDSYTLRMSAARFIKTIVHPKILQHFCHRLPFLFWKKLHRWHRRRQGNILVIPL